jgi:hypothetical protein
MIRVCERYDESHWYETLLYWSFAIATEKPPGCTSQASQATPAHLASRYSRPKKTIHVHWHGDQVMLRH